MRYARPVMTAATLVAAAACHGGAAHPPTAAPAPAAEFHAAEPHLANIRQLTHGGENAEAYFSTDGKRLIFQSTRDGRSCDQEFVMNTDGSAQQRISDGTGKTTCGYFFAYNTKVFYASTRAADTACPKKPDPSRGYVWGLDKYDIYTANADGSGTHRLTRNNVYTAEGTLSPDGKTIVFTMNVDGTSVRRLTNTPGYDGGPFFSPDGKRIVYRAYHPTDSTELAQYRDLLSQSIVRPNKMEIWVMNADGSDQHQITHLGGANFAPFFTPDGRRIIFSSNYTNPHSGEFDLYLINDDGSSLEPVTSATGFDGFPQFSPDGKQLVWASSRNATGEHQLDLFIADWKP